MYICLTFQVYIFVCVFLNSLSQSHYFEKITQILININIEVKSLYPQVTKASVNNKK